MQVAFYLAGEITQVKESIPWVRCASGNVLLCNFHLGILKVPLKLVVPRNNQKLLTRHVLDYTTSISTSSRQKLRKFRVRGVC